MHSSKRIRRDFEASPGHRAALDFAETERSIPNFECTVSAYWQRPSSSACASLKRLTPGRRAQPSRAQGGLRTLGELRPCTFPQEMPFFPATSVLRPRTRKDADPGRRDQRPFLLAPQNPEGVGVISRGEWNDGAGRKYIACCTHQVPFSG